MSMATKRAGLLIGKGPRVDRYEGTTCSAPGCTRTCRALSRFCTIHASRYYRTRNPNGRMPRKSELVPWRERARYALDHYGLGQHPAIVAAERTLEQMISRTDGIPPRIAKHWNRLNQGGATGRDMLLNILSVYGLCYVGLPDRFTDDHLFFCCLGSRFLRTVSTGNVVTRTGKVDQARLPGLDAEAVGQALAQKVGALALMFWRRAEDEHNKRAAELLSIREALEQHPL
jgi:hypothetical protein